MLRCLCYRLNPLQPTTLPSTSLMSSPGHRRSALSGQADRTSLETTKYVPETGSGSPATSANAVATTPNPLIGFTETVDVATLATPTDGNVTTLPSSPTTLRACGVKFKICFILKHRFTYTPKGSILFNVEIIKGLQNLICLIHQ